MRGIATGVVDADLDAELSYRHRAKQIGGQPSNVRHTLFSNGTLDRTERQRDGRSRVLVPEVPRSASQWCRQVSAVGQRHEGARRR